MYKRTTASFLALVMIAAAMVPLATADPGEYNRTPGYDHFEDIDAPAGLVWKGEGRTLCRPSPKTCLAKANFTGRKRKRIGFRDGDESA